MMGLVDENFKLENIFLGFGKCFSMVSNVCCFEKTNHLILKFLMKTSKFFSLDTLSFFVYSAEMQFYNVLPYLNFFFGICEHLVRYFKSRTSGRLLWLSSVWESMLALQAAWVQFLNLGTRSLLQSMAKIHIYINR